MSLVANVPTSMVMVTGTVLGQLKLFSYSRYSTVNPLIFTHDISVFIILIFKVWSGQYIHNVMYCMHVLSIYFRFSFTHKNLVESGSAVEIL